MLDRLATHLDAALEERSGWLKDRDISRSANVGWKSRSGQSVYTFYVDRFAGSLSGVIDRLDYLKDIGVQWLHPLPLLRSRPGNSDGGFAVSDYLQVEPALGTMDDLKCLTDELRARNMGLLLDVVCNHTAREHDWAERARSGDPRYRAYYHTLSDQETVRQWERDLIDVFPDTAPGSFTYDADMGGWVWTTFYPFQWDLNYANPDVFVEMLDVLIFLANQGVEGFRLDSAPFLWKRQGTSCRNQPEAYAIVEAWRAALDIVAPSVVLIAEAIESLDDVLPFFGTTSSGCDLAYNNGVMTALWGALADADAGIAHTVIDAAAARPQGATWLNYVRCHDDLIWNALSAYAPVEDLKRWSDFYAGTGFGDGRAFQTAEGGVPSTNGMAAALAGLGKLGVDQSLALKRLQLLYGIIHALDGWPLIYMGDELALGNDPSFLKDPVRRDEGRWLHRPGMDWKVAEQRHEAGSNARQMFDCLRAFGDHARHLNTLGVAGRARAVTGLDPQVLAFTRTEGSAPLLVLANLGDTPITVRLPDAFETGGQDVLGAVKVEDGHITLSPYGLCWWVMSS